MTWRHRFAFSPPAFFARGILLVPPSSQRAQGMPGARCTRSLAYDKKTKYTSVVTTGHTGKARHSPRNGFNGCYVLAPVLRACWPPSPACLNANLTPASRCQAHTSLPSASGAPVRSTISVHRIPPRVVDVAQRPFGGAGREQYRIIRIFGKEEYFFGQALTSGSDKGVGMWVICPSGHDLAST